MEPIGRIEEKGSNAVACDEGSICQIEQPDNPVVIEIVQLTGMSMAQVSKFWRRAAAREQGDRLYELSRVKEIGERFPILASLSSDSLPYEIFYVSRRIHAEVIRLLAQVPEGSKAHFRGVSPREIMISPQLFLQLVKDVPPPKSFYEEILGAATESIRRKIERLDLKLFDEDGRLPDPDCCSIL